MSELIRRQDAIKAIEDLPNCYNGFSDTYDKACIIGTLEEVPSAQQWIPCSERLPNVRQWVLCQCRMGIMDVLRLTADGSWNKNYPYTVYMHDFVVAWMPLPKPYVGGTE